MDPNPPRENPATDAPDIRQTPEGKYQYHDRTGHPVGGLHDDRDAAERFAQEQRRRADTPKDGGVGGSRDR